MTSVKTNSCQLNILFYGNCQPWGFMSTLNLDANKYKVKYLECYLDNFNEEYFENIIQESDVIITQSINDNYRGRHYLSTKFIINNCKKNCKIIIVDSLYFDFYYFDLTYTSFQNKLLHTPIDYHYNCMIDCYRNNESPAYYLENYVHNENLKTKEELQEIANNSLNELRKRYEENQIKYKADNILFIHAGDYIKANYKEKLLFYSMNHPSKYLMQFVCEEILKILRIPNTIDYSRDDIADPKCLIYKCIQNVVNFNIKECPSLTSGKTSKKDICDLYYSSYKKIKFK